MLDVLSSFFELAGFALIVVALWLIFAPLGMIALGLSLIGAGYGLGDRA